MNISLQIYIDSPVGALCFTRATQEVIKNTNMRLDLTVAEGDTGNGNDMRKTLECVFCGKQFITATI